MAIQVKNHVLINGWGEGGDLVIPSAVDGAAIEAIGMSAFFANARLTGVTIPRGVKRIGDSAFCGCENMRAVTLPEGLQTICASAFRGCSSLRSVVIPDGMTGIGPSAFASCTSLEHVVLPKGMTDISYGAFYGCTSLKSVVFSGSMKSIGPKAFSQCTSLKSVVFPDGAELSEDILEGCSALESVDLTASSDYYHDPMPRINAPATLKRVSIRAWKNSSWDVCGGNYNWTGWLHELLSANPGIRELILPKDAETGHVPIPPNCRITRR